MLADKARPGKNTVYPQGAPNLPPPGGHGIFSCMSLPPSRAVCPEVSGARLASLCLAPPGSLEPLPGLHLVWAGQLPDAPRPDSPWEISILDPTFPFVGRSGGNCSLHRPQGETEGRGIEDPLGRAPHFCGDGGGWGWAGRPVEELPFNSREQFRRRLAFCPQTLDALTLTLVMLEPRPQHPLRPAVAPKYVAPRTDLLQASTPRLLFSQPRLPLQQGPCCVPQRAKVPGALVLGLVPASVPSPGVHPPGPTPHTQTEPWEAELEGSTTNISGAPEKPGGVLTTCMGGTPGRGDLDPSLRAQASMRQEGLQACRCPRRPTRLAPQGTVHPRVPPILRSSHPSPPALSPP